MSNIIITTESGSDITLAQAAQQGIEIIPMHIEIGDESFDDGEISAAEMLEICRQRGLIPQTSGSSPADFDRVFDRIHENNPDAQIVHLAYSAVTTCSYQSAQLSAKERPYVTILDTKQVSGGLRAIVEDTAAFARNNPNAGVADILRHASDLCKRTHSAFVPHDLAFLRAGGRLSNVAYIGGQILRIKPMVEIVDGRLVATKKLHGNLPHVTRTFIGHFLEKYQPDLSCVTVLRSPGLPKRIEELATELLDARGFRRIRWSDTGNVITSHSGPKCIGLSFYAEKSLAASC